MRVRLALLSVALLATPFLAYGYTFPGTAVGYVNDFAGLLSESDKQAIEQKLSDFDTQTSNQIAVATIASLEGDTVENFSTKLFEDWGVGTKNNDNGVLLLIARDDRKVRIEVGYGLEGALTDIQANDIIQNDIVPAFREEAYADGIQRATDNIMAATQGEYQVSREPLNLSGLWSVFEQYGVVLFFGFVILQWVGAMLARSKSWWGGGIVGGVLAGLFGLFLGVVWGIVSLLLLVPLGLLLDFLISSTYKKTSRGKHLPWWTGGGYGGGGSSSSGGFGGFGGGSSGGGGASGGW